MQGFEKIYFFRRTIGILGLLAVLAFPNGIAQARAADGDNPCDRLLSGGFDPLVPGSNPKQAEDLPALFARGFLPAPMAPEQLDLFEFYRILYLGDPTYLMPNALDREIMDAFLAHPNLRKEPFRNFELSMAKISYPVTDALHRFITAQKMAFGQSHARLFRIAENPKPWKEILQYRPGNDGDFAKFLEARIPAEFLKPLPLADFVTGKYRALKLFRFLQQQPETPARNQAIVDLVHSIGYHDPTARQALLDRDGMKRLEAYRKILAERERFLKSVGLLSGFRTFLVRMRIDQATGTHSEQQILETLAVLEDGILEGGSVEDFTQRTVRHLSLMESPFRGCIGGDCSTRLFPKIGLDPEFHFFTITDPNGSSSGQVSVVLGSGIGPGGNAVPVAFLDKIQGISVEDLAPMIEGVRRSVAEKGFRLALPSDLGVVPMAISNQGEVVAAIPHRIRVGETVIHSFEPRPNGYPFRDPRERDFSRAFLNLDCHEVLPMNESAAIKLRPGEVVQSWTLDEISSGEFMRTAVSLKHGNSGDQIKYVVLMMVMRQRGLTIDPDFDRILQDWMRDPAVDFKVRKQVLIEMWSNGEQSLPALLDYFNPAEQVTVIQNLLDTPRYFEQIETGDPRLIQQLLVRFRHRTAIVNALVGPYLADLPWNTGFETEVRGILPGLLQRREWADSELLDLLENLKWAVSSGTVDEFLPLLRTQWGAGVRADLFRLATSHFHHHWGTDDLQVERGLSELLFHEAAEAFELGVHLVRLNGIRERHAQAIAGTSLMKLYHQLLGTADDTQTGFLRELSAWIENPRIAVGEKSEFLISLIGVPGAGFLSWLKRIPAEQERAVLEYFSEKTALPVFRAIAKKRGVEEFLLEQGTRESFEFHRAIGAGGEFEVQSRTVTELQWRLVMGSGSAGARMPAFDLWSESKVLAGPRIVNVSWHDVQQFLTNLNAADPLFQYRLPTRVEQDLLIRYKAGVPVVEKIGRFRANDPSVSVAEWIQDADAGTRSASSWKLGFRLIRTRK